MNTLIKDYMPLNVKAVSNAEASLAKINNIPLFRGVLYENLVDDFGNDILKPVSTNTVVIGGAILALEHLTATTADFMPGTLNSILNINADVADTSGSRPSIALFGLGTGGASLDFGSIVAKDIKSRNIPGLVPMRVGENLSGPDAAKYFMKKLNSDGTTYSWYLKEFADAIQIKTLWKDALEEDVDGTEITSEVYDSDRTEGIESFAEIKISLNINDVRDYFLSIGEQDMARYNTLGIYTGNKVTLPDGSTDYVNVRLFAYTNFNNRDLSQATEALYTYRIYSLT